MGCQNNARRPYIDEQVCMYKELAYLVHHKIRINLEIAPSSHMFALHVLYYMKGLIDNDRLSNQNYMYAVSFPITDISLGHVCMFSSLIY